MIDITIAIVTYNHAQFIEQALKSVLSQETTLNIEILIGDDGSTDGTSNIVKRYEALYPNKIKAFYHDRSKVIYVDGRPTAKYNYLNNLQHAKGRYIAILDGDDYWTSNNKLQIQWEFMEKNPQISTCFHAVKIFNEQQQQSRIAKPPGTKKFYSLRDLIPDNFIHTSSVMFRNGVLQEFPDWFYKISFGDWAQHLLHAATGEIGYINECMSAYRLHSGGVWSTHNAKKRIGASIEVLQYFNQHTNGLYEHEIKRAIQRFEYNLVLKLLDIDNVEGARAQFRELSMRPKQGREISIAEYAYIRVCTQSPMINRLFTSLLKRIQRLI